MTISTQLKFEYAPPATEKGFMPILNEVVTVTHCYYYLALIERFWRLLDTMNRDQQRLYLARAEFRYTLWVLAFGNKKMPTPPLDIAFMWHTHLLSPFRFYEDVVLRIPSAKMLLETPIPLAAVHREAANGPTNETLMKWKKLFGESGEPYELSVNNIATGNYCTHCVRCQHEIRLPWTIYVGYRYGENTTSFAHHCGIDQKINFLDVARMKLEYDMPSKRKKRSTVAGTLLGPDGMPRKKPNAMIPMIAPLQQLETQNEMDYSYELQIEHKLKQLGKKYEYDANELLYAIRTCYQGNPSIFSIDLIHAVARQRKFHDAALSMDWNPPHGFASAIRRYHDFLILLKNDSSLIAVPTIEIDCAWHTHMLFAGSYRRFTLGHLKRVINHDDTIPESSLKKYINDTNKAWIQSSINYWITHTDRKGYNGVYEVSLAVDNGGLGPTYYPGKVYSEKRDRYHIARFLNGEIARNRRETPTRISAHCKDIPKLFYRDDIDIEKMKAIQTFIGEGMKKTSYGYVGTASCGTGGKSAIYSSDDRNHIGKIISSDKPRWYQLGAPKIQNIYRDLEGSKSASHRFHDTSTSPNPVLRRYKSRDDIGIYYQFSDNGKYINYRPNMYNEDNPEIHGRRIRGSPAAGIIIVAASGGGGGGGGCGGGGGGGGC